MIFLIAMKRGIYTGLTSMMYNKDPFEVYNAFFTGFIAGANNYYFELMEDEE
jgi:hypothetical protein